MDGHVPVAIEGIFGIDKPHGDKRPGILGGIGGGGDKLADVEARIRRPMHHFLTGCVVTVDHDRFYGMGQGVIHDEAEPVRCCVQQMGHPFAAPHHADEHPCVVKSFDGVEHHGRTGLCGALNGPAAANVAIDPGKFRVGVNGDVGFVVVSLDGFQMVESGSQVGDFRCGHGGIFEET